MTGVQTCDLPISLYAILISACILFLLFALQTWLPGYSNRDYSAMQRILTESRVLIFYIGLMLVPRLSEFGLNHDDIIISTSLFSPWTTIVSIIIIVALISYAILYRKKYPYFSIGVLWFFTSHLLESTIIPLDIAYEHRNYLALLGPLFVLYEMARALAKRGANKTSKYIFIILILSFSFTTLIRSQSWSSLALLFETETQNHPLSPRSWMDLANLQETMGESEKSIVSLDKAIALNPYEPAYFANLFYKYRYLHKGIPPNFDVRFDRAIKKKDRKSTRLNSSHIPLSRMPSSA